MEIDLKKEIGRLSEFFRPYITKVRARIVALVLAFRTNLPVLRQFISPEKKFIVSFLWILLFLIGVMGGYALKTLADESITIGHEDYKLKDPDTLYNLNTLREAALRAGAKLPVETQKEYPAEYKDGFVPGE